MTPVKVWQERVEIPTYETAAGYTSHVPENRVYQDRPARFIPTA